MEKLNVKACGLALGILWGVSMALMGLLAIVCSWAQPFVDAVGSMYIGYSASIIGSLAGAVWGVVDGFIGGVVFAWLYNKFI